MSFKTEQQLFNKAMESPYIKNLVETMVYPSFAYIEPKGLFGIPDLVIVNIELINNQIKIFRSFAFEMKLTAWKRALKQAYRYRSFANFSLVIIDHSHVKPAVKQLDLFKNANIGLLSIDNSGYLSQYYLPKYNDPYSIKQEKNLFNIIKRQEHDITWDSSLINIFENDYIQ